VALQLLAPLDPEPGSSAAAVDGACADRPLQIREHPPNEASRKFVAGLVGVPRRDDRVEELERRQIGGTGRGPRQRRCGPWNRPRVEGHTPYLSGQVRFLTGIFVGRAAAHP
jgi:hypothetical protein